ARYNVQLKKQHTLLSLSRSCRSGYRPNSCSYNRISPLKIQSDPTFAGFDLEFDGLGLNVSVQLR
ncbi:hypothetical protein MTR67_000348, partial [Solanum verrucosum]